MEEAAQASQSTKPEKPTSIKILQWVYLFLGFGLFIFSIVLQPRGDGSLNSKLGLYVFFSFLPVVLAFLCNGFGFFIYTKSSVLIGFIISATIALWFVIGLLLMAYGAETVYYRFFDFRDSFGVGEYVGGPGQELLGQWILFFYSYIVLVILSLMSIPAVIINYKKLRRSSLEKPLF